jgi:pantoate--beta-alanine ligase
MQIARSYKELQKIRAALKGRLAYVPTMGALHKGHLSLIKVAKNNASNVALSIFVNPTQFAPHEDFDSYPREIDNDLTKLEAAGVDLIYIPEIKDIYPDGPQADIKTGDAALSLESDFRPHFFGGVLSVVYRLFDQMKPDIAIFGEKDFQQLQVITEMVKEKNLPIEIIGAPIVRDDHGLALSSRNAYLSPEELGIARTLNEALFIAAEKINAGVSSQDAIEEVEKELLAVGFDKIDYIAKRWNRLLAAAYLGKTRLIDNVALK